MRISSFALAALGFITLAGTSPAQSSPALDDATIVAIFDAANTFEFAPCRIFN